jgi:thioredoxin-related protein
MKRVLICLATALALCSANAGDLQWTTDAAKAVETAKKESKIVVLHFTGSDWCGFCIKQHKEVFDTSEFSEYAKKNLVLVDIDFPNKKTLPDDLKKTNEELKKKYSIEGYPTLVFLSADGKELGRKVGYAPGSGPKAVISEIDKARGKS